MSMTVIEHIEVGSGGAASIVFDLIPDTYTDLYLVCSLRSSRAGNIDDIIGCDINGSSANFTTRYLYGSGSSVTSGTSQFVFFSTAASSTSNTFSNGELYIPNYAGSTNKSISVNNVSENNATGAYMNITAQLWAQTAAITSLTLVTNHGFVQYSSATLFGITAGSSGGVTVS